MRALIVLLWLSSVAFGDTHLSYDKAFRHRGETGQARLALEGFRSLSQQDPTNFRWWWRRSMACQFVGSRLEKEKARRLALFTEGADAGKKAVALQADCAPCLFWEAINMALYGQERGIVRMLFTLGPIRERLEKSAKIDPSYAHAGAYRVLGLIHQKVPLLLGGSDRQARRYFDKAIRKAPGNALNYLVLAKLWMDELDEPARAKEVVETGLGYPAPEPNDIESFEAAGELRRLRDKLRGLSEPAS